MLVIVNRLGLSEDYFTEQIESVMQTNGPITLRDIMLHSPAIDAHYDRERKALVIDFADGTTGTWPVRLLEMVRYDGDAWVPVEATEAQLEAVELGGEHISWDELDQDFRISDLKAGIYGRESWMASLASINNWAEAEDFLSMTETEMVEASREALAEYRRSGEGVTQEEMEAWAVSLADGTQTA
ncbi:MAG: DUF2442 domain-containing protein [Cyanobacteria bacterium J06621_3]